MQVFDSSGRFETQWTNLHRTCALFNIEGATRLPRGAGLGGWGSNRNVPNIGPRVTVMNTKGERLARVGHMGYGLGAGQFVAPHGVCLDSRGNLYVAEVAHTHMSHFGDVPEGVRSLQKAGQGNLRPNARTTNVGWIGSMAKGGRPDNVFRCPWCYTLAESGLAKEDCMATTSTSSRTAKRMAEASGRFLESLTPEQKAKATYEYLDGERVFWYYPPLNRHGLPLRDMDGSQREVGIRNHGQRPFGPSLRASRTDHRP